MPWPSASHEAPPRVALRTRLTPAKDSQFARRFSSGTRRPSIRMSAWWMARLATLPVITSGE